MNVDFFGNDDDGYESIVIPNGYQQANQPPQCPDVEWDWFQEIDDDLWIAELAPGPVGPNAPPRIFDEPPWDWTQDEDEPPTQIDYDPGAIEIDNNPIITIEDAFDWSAQDDDEQAPLDQSSPVVLVSATQYFGDDAEQFDEAIEPAIVQSGFQQADVAVVISPTQYFGDDSEQFDEALEHAIVPAGFQQVDAAAVAPSQFFEEPFDWEDSPPDYMADDFGNDDADPPVADAWDWSHQDDDEQAVPDDPIGASVAVALVQPPEDAFEAPQDADDDEWIARDSDPVGPDAIGYAPYDDAWDWSQGDEEVLAVTDEALSANLPTTASAIPDDWNWVSCDADNDFEWALEPNGLVATVPTLLPRIIVTPNANRAVVPNADRTLVARASRKVP